MIFRENTSFACNNIKIYVCVTSGAVLLTDWVDLDTTFAVQLRETARVLVSQGARPGPMSTQCEPPPRVY